MDETRGAATKCQYLTASANPRRRLQKAYGERVCLHASEMSSDWRRRRYCRLIWATDLRLITDPRAAETPHWWKTAASGHIWNLSHPSSSVYKEIRSLLLFIPTETLFSDTEVPSAPEIEKVQPFSSTAVIEFEEPASVGGVPVLRYKLEWRIPGQGWTSKEYPAEEGESGIAVECVITREFSLLHCFLRVWLCVSGCQPSYPPGMWRHECMHKQDEIF